VPPPLAQGKPVPIVRLAINSVIMELYAQRYNVMVLPIGLFVVIPIIARPVMSALYVTSGGGVPATAQQINVYSAT
jgi:hypothetical protein